MVYACDRTWWNVYYPQVHKACSGEFWTVNREAAQLHGLNYIRSQPGTGVSNVPNTIYEGGNSGFQAVSLALHFGAARIFLLGYDMQLTGRRTHWHGDHRGKLKNNPDAIHLKQWVHNFAKLAQHASAEIINCSRHTALTCFPRQTPELALGSEDASVSRAA